MLITCPAAGHSEGRVEGWRAGADPEELLGREDGCRGGGEGGRMGAVILNIGPLDTAPARSGDTRGEGGADMKTVECGAN